MGTYSGSDWTDEDGRIYRRIHAQVSAGIAAERHAAGVPLILEHEQADASEEMVEHVLDHMCSASDISRARRRARRGQAVTVCWVVELWGTADGRELMMALEFGPRDADLRYDPHGKRHMNDEPVFDG